MVGQKRMDKHSIVVFSQENILMYYEFKPKGFLDRENYNDASECIYVRQFKIVCRKKQLYSPQNESTTHFRFITRSLKLSSFYIFFFCNNSLLTVRTACGKIAW